MNLTIKSELSRPQVEERLKWAELDMCCFDSLHILSQLPHGTLVAEPNYHCDCGTLIGRQKSSAPDTLDPNKLSQHEERLKRDESELDYWLGGISRLMSNSKIESLGLYHYWGDGSTLDRLELKLRDPIRLSQLTEDVLRSLEPDTLLQLEFDSPPEGYTVLGEREEGR